MDVVIKHRKKRLYKLYSDYEYHAWLVDDVWVQHKLCKNIIDNKTYKVSYITREKYNPLPFHNNIYYVGIIHIIL